MGPIDYSGGAQPLNPMQRGMQAFALGDALRQKQIAEQQAQIQAQQQAQMQAELSALAGKPGGGSVQDYAATITRYAATNPKLGESLKEAMSSLSKEQKQKALEHSSQVLSALSTGRGDVAGRMLDERAAAMENTGDTQGAAKARAMAEEARTNPQSLMPTFTGLVLSIEGGDKVVAGFSAIGDEARKRELAPSVLSESQSKATTAAATAKYAEPRALAETQGAQADAVTKGVAAKYAESDALLSLEKKGWDIKALKADIDFKRESNRIAAMNASANREGNTLKRQELQLKIDDTIRARDEHILKKAADFEAAKSGVNDIYEQIRRVKDHPGFGAAVGLSSWWAAMPGTEARSAANEIEKLIAMVAAGNLEKLKGPMSDKDIIFLKAIGSNLDRKQKMEFLLPELNRLENWSVDKDIQLRKQYGLPAGGVNPPAAPPQPAPKPSTPGVPAAAGAQRNIVVNF